MTNDQDQPKTIERQIVTYYQNERYFSEFITGIYGGVATNGTISINFFRDKLVIPDSITIEVDENRVIKEVGKAGGEGVKRDVFFEGIFDLNTSKVLVNWLITKISEYETQIKK